MTDAILALNAGSSSIKFGLFQTGPDDAPKLVSRGVLDDGAAMPRLAAKDREGHVLIDRQWPDGASHQDVLDAMLGWIEGHLGDVKLIGVGHRIVHGGRLFSGPVRLDDATIEAIDGLTPLAPLHQGRSLEPIRALRALRPDLPQVGCFDTAFHHDLAPPVSRYAIPRRFEDAGIRKYGFHGLSYEYVASRLPEIDLALPAKRTVVAHLGQGASLCAMMQGRSLDTTMGFSALDGLVMGTRCGAIDPGVVIHLQREHGLSVEAVEQMLYHESGLKGVSGLSGDMRTLSASDDPHARQAIDLFAFRVARETAAMANTMGGLEALIFTGGIGENSPQVRAAVSARLAWLGAHLDAEANETAAHRIDSRTGAVEIRIIPTDEEIVIAKHTATML